MKKSLLALVIPAIALTGCGNSVKDSASNYAPTAVPTPNTPLHSVPAGNLLESEPLTGGVISTKKPVHITAKKPNNAKRPPLPIFVIPSNSGKQDNATGNGQNPPVNPPTDSNLPTNPPPPAVSGVGQRVGLPVTNILPKLDDMGHPTKDNYTTFVTSVSGSTDLRRFDELLNDRNGELMNVTADDTGKLALKNFSHNAKVDGFNTYDIGVNAVAKGDSNNKAFSAVKTYFRGNDVVYLRDPAAAGFQYQTFGQAFSYTPLQVNSRPQSLGFMSVGQAYRIDPTLTFEATYKGIAMGTYNDVSQTMADMEAKLKWGTDNRSRSLEVSIDNTKLSKNNLQNLKYNQIEAAPASFNFKDTLVWNGASFVSTNGTAAYIYGPKAEEIGGTFDRSRSDGSYLGAFGGTRQK